MSLKIHLKKSQKCNLKKQDLLNIYGRYGWEHYYQGQIGNQITLYFRRDIKPNQPEVNIKLSPEEKAILQCLDKEQMP